MLPLITPAGQIFVAGHLGMAGNNLVTKVAFTEMAQRPLLWPLRSWSPKAGKPVSLITVEAVWIPAVDPVS